MNWLSNTARQLSGTFANFGRNLAERLSLVPVFLGHLLWILSQEFYELAQNGYKNNAAVYACLNLLCISVPEPPLIAYTRTADGEPGERLPYTHPLRALIRRPNPLMTEFEFWEMVTLHTGIVGISHWWKERDNIGRIRALWPLRPDRVGPIYANPDDDEMVLLGWSYQIPGTMSYLPIPKGDVLTFNFPDPAGQSGGVVEGLGPLQVLASEVGADNEATRFVGSLLTNAAIPGTILQVKGSVTSTEDAAILKQSFISQFGGPRKGEPMVVDDGTVVTQTGFSLQQLEFPALRKISESRIAAAFGVPAVLVGLLVGLEAAIKATTDELRAFFAETTLSSYWKRYSDQYTNDIAAEFDPRIVCVFDTKKVRALASVAAIRLAQVAEAYQNAAITVNEYREVLGFDPRDDGDRYIYGIGSGRGMESPIQAGATADDAASVAETPVPQPPAPTGTQPPAGNGTGDQGALPTKAVPLLTEGHDALHSAFAEMMAGIEAEPTPEPATVA